MRIEIDLGERTYPVIIGQGLLEKASDYLSDYIRSEQVCIVTNDVVAPLYLECLCQQLKDNYRLITVVLPDGEKVKTLETLNQIYTQLLENGFNRDATLIALGGGVVGDMTGFAAATFMRGVDFIQIPSTLLAQVDSSVGGKTGVNHALGKNMIGAFYQPKCVLADVGMLDTLPDRELSAGIAEVIKYGLIQDEDFLGWLSESMPNLMRRDGDSLAYAVKKSCECKAYVVSEDEKEKGLRAILNLGHTFGHALESHYKYTKYLHGEAVAIGMVIALKLSELMGNISRHQFQEAERLIASAELPVRLDETLELETLLGYMKVDKKAESGQIKLVLLRRMGEAMTTKEFDYAHMQSAINFVMPG